MLRIGMFLGNRYEIMGKIGSGGMSDVYKAKCHTLNRNVAIKVLKAEFSSDQGFVSKFRMEAQSAACLSHPNIVNIFDVGEEGGIHYIVMELIEGITLKKYIERKKKLEIRESIEVAMQVARGLEAAHSEHIVHRDIKPQNIMISKEGKVKVTDFGIARAASSQTISSNTMGSVHYISPEQARGGYCDERSDIYSLGITLYEMLTGRVPFEGDSTVAVALLHIQGEMVPPREYEPLIPISLEKIILKCTQKKPDARYASATELIEDLKKSLTMPNEDFVKVVPLTSDSPTMVFSGDDVEKIKKESARVTMDTERRKEQAYQMGRDEDEESDDEFQDEDEDEDEDDDTDSHFEKIITYISIGVAILIVLIAVVIGMKACGVLNFGSGETTTTESTSDTTKSTMIKVLGMTSAEAETELEKLGLHLKITYGPSEDYPEGQIYEQDVQEGEIVDRSTYINVKVSTGSDKLTIPSNLAGMSVQDARRALSTAGFTNISNTTAEEFSDTIDTGAVIGTNPSMGTSVGKGESITLIVSKGKAPVPTTVPNLYELSESAALTKLSDAGLVAGEITKAYSDDVEEGLIISQSPSSGTSLNKGDSVSFVISRGPSKIEVPDVSGMSATAASALLKEYGFRVTFDSETSDNSDKDLVLYTTPSAGSKQEKGTTITVVIGEGHVETTTPPTTAAETTTTAHQDGEPNP